MSAEPKGQYLHTAILRKAAPIQNWSTFQSLRVTQNHRPKSFKWKRATGIEPASSAKKAEIIAVIQYPQDAQCRVPPGEMP